MTFRNLTLRKRDCWYRQRKRNPTNLNLNMLGLIMLTVLMASIPEFFCRVTTEEEYSILEGKSLTIACHYEPQYAGYVKYWCQGKTRDFCDTKARTDDLLSTNPKVSIFDDPVQELFTVTMEDLKEDDSGSYMCGVEIGGVWNRDAVAFTYINVINGMSVMHHSVSGEEGKSVTVECFYSERYRESEKKWCRSGNWRSCLQTGSEGKYDDGSVAIIDDKKEALTVTLKKLQKEDAGWYWCYAGQQKKAIQVIVTPQLSTTLSPAARLTSNQPLEQKALQTTITPCQPHESAPHLVWLVIVAFLSCVVLLGLLLTRTLWKPHMSDSVLMDVKVMSGPLNEHSSNDDDLQNAAAIFFSKDSQKVPMY
ncbi:polymeric immunoglobulin receptor [Gouania willdenowi]|uniref:Polymeric immunoglobulin receptor-like n=1 Tax=Gouania willdenowi TaxID=441366 RepID=A0A8C5GXL6_GOUWI|nr:polymeric immunoglobulin receptor-like [Gouania willdenowi]